ncbi:MAG: hypothetical protein WCG94_08050, partial [Methanothrix sp.]
LKVIIFGVVALLGVTAGVMALAIGVGSSWGGSDGKVGPSGSGDNQIAADSADPATAVLLDQLRSYTDPDKMLKKLQASGGPDALKQQLNDTATAYRNLPALTDAQRAQGDQIIKEAVALIDQKLVPIMSRTKAATENDAKIRQFFSLELIPKLSQLQSLIAIPKSAASTVSLAKLVIQKNQGGANGPIKHPGTNNPGYRLNSASVAASFLNLNQAADYLITKGTGPGMDCSGFISNILVASGIMSSSLNTSGFATSSLFTHKYNIGTTNQKGAVIDPAKVTAASFLPGDIIVSGLNRRPHVILVLDSAGNVAQSTTKSGLSGPMQVNITDRQSFMVGTLDDDVVVLRPKYAGE